MQMMSLQLPSRQDRVTPAPRLADDPDKPHVPAIKFAALSSRPSRRSHGGALCQGRAEARADATDVSGPCGACRTGPSASTGRAQNDQRSLQVALTPHGAALAARFMPVAAHYERVATGNMSAKDAATLKATLVQLYENLDRLEQEVEDGEIEKLIGSGPQRRPKRSAKRRTKAAR
jgi:hypothetical protein